MAKTKKTAKKPTRGKAKSAKATKKPAMKAKAKSKAKPAKAAKAAPKKKAAAKKPAARKAAPKQEDTNGNGESPSMAESPVPEITGMPPMDGGHEVAESESDEGESDASYE